MKTLFKSQVSTPSVRHKTVTKDVALSAKDLGIVYVVNTYRGNVTVDLPDAVATRPTWIKHEAPNGHVVNIINGANVIAKLTDNHDAVCVCYVNGWKIVDFYAYSLRKGEDNISSSSSASSQSSSSSSSSSHSSSSSPSSLSSNGVSSSSTS